MKLLARSTPTAFEASGRQRLQARGGAHARDRGIEFAAENENPGTVIEKHQRDHRGGEAGIVGHVGIGEAGKIAAEGDAAGEPEHQRRGDARPDAAERPLPVRQPHMQDGERHGEHDAADAETRNIVVGFERLDPRHIGHGGLEDQRPEDDHERQHQQRHRADQHIADQLEPQQPPAALLVEPIGAVETDAQALDAARGEIDREHGAQRKHAAMRAREHALNLVGDRVRHFRRPGGNDEACDLIGEIVGADEARNARHHDEEREHRHQDRECDMARDRPAVVAVEAVERVPEDAVAQADGVQGSPPRGAEPIR